ncbi:MAG TPA: sensor histidine kinase [Mycobacteriales bacterium]|nr:sensor histidine kinase [Mycobacteriales bacterium]
MSRRSGALDAAIAFAVAVLGGLEAFWGIDATHRQGPHWAEAALYVITGGLLAVRRVTPIGCMTAIVVVSTAEFALFGAPEGMGVALPGVIAGYTIGRRVEGRSSWWGPALAVLLWAAWTGLDPMTAKLADRWMTLIWLGPWLIAWLVGALVRATAQASEQRRLVREQRASRAVVEERNRIARELHDVIGHSVSVMTVQASAVRRRLHEDQSTERQALETVEAVGREALAEMRRMVGVLRQDGDGMADREPPPGLAQVERLVAKFRAAGLPVHLHVSGAAGGLAPGLDLTAYRLLQEGLTNTLRHALSPTRVDIRIERAHDRLELAVRDDGRGPLAAVEPGHGLLGMHERVSVYGGSLVTRPRPTGGFELVATLPLDDAPAAPLAQEAT